MLFGLLGLLLLILAGAVALVFLFANTYDLPNVQVGKVMLDCPHCGRETSSHRETCEHCGKSFRDSVIKPVDVPH